VSAPATTWRALRDDTARRLASASLANPAHEARWIVEEASGLSGADLVAAELEHPTEAAIARVDVMVQRRLTGEPLQYVLGSWSFCGVDLFVDRRVLIPRPETELVVERALQEAERLGGRRGRRAPWTGTATEYAVADLGTGSGAIALVLATELPDAAVWATDASDDALAVARANVAGVGAAGARVRVARGDWFDALPSELRGALRVVVSNPPYLRDDEVEDLPPEVVQHEPHRALVSGRTGLEATEQIVSAATRWLEPGGALVLEVDSRRAEESAALARAAGLGSVRIDDDLAGRPRILVARRA